MNLAAARSVRLEEFGGRRRFSSTIFLLVRALGGCSLESLPSLKQSRGDLYPVTLRFALDFFFFLGAAGFQTQHLTHTGQVLYH